MEFFEALYRNQWTTSGDKKLVVDASQELRRYRRRHQEPLLFSDQDVATEPGNSAAAELYPEYPEYPRHADRDTHTQHQVGGAQQGLFTITLTHVIAYLIEPFYSTLLREKFSHSSFSR